jgi:hypothetical protein
MKKIKNAQRANGFNDLVDGIMGKILLTIESYKLNVTETRQVRGYVMGKLKEYMNKQPILIRDYDENGKLIKIPYKEPFSIDVINYKNGVEII